MGYGAELVARARDLAPALAGRAQAAEERRRLPDETVTDLTGFLDVLVPKAAGGRELDLATAVGICREIGAGCTSTGWLSAIYLLHNWMLSLFPKRAQHEVFANRPYALAPCVLAPTGSAEPAEGGHRLTGRWSWGSGVMHADWVMVTALTGAFEPRVFLLPRAEVTVHDVWHVSGMRATGSNDIEARGAFVPEHRSLPLLDVARGTTPGAALHEGPAYRWPLVPVLTLVGASPVLGAAEGLLARFRERLESRVMAYTGIKQRDLMSGQIRLARATAELAAARLLLEDAVAALERTYASSGRYTLADRARARLVGAHVVGTARTVVGDLCVAAGASAQFMDSPFQRVQRDVATISGHVVFDLDATYALYGKVELGVELDPTTLV
ncbi:acyl-CoA dehydrogenase family protein [Actinomadura scrupuli]|uniref:acyl-CoA dehydrogenase family protein n=1 Tax=Actinomadura scrupuli TaxID=559629 RepID=UPI003D9998C5